MTENFFDLGIVTAMPVECEAFASFMGLKKHPEISPFVIYTAHHANQRIVLIVSGIGQTNASLATSYLLHHFILLVYFFGIAGSVNPEFKIGNVVLGKAVFSLDLYAFSLRKSGYL